MSSSSQFKHVNGRNGKVESICMKCLLAVGICCSDEELRPRKAATVATRKPEYAPRHSQVAPAVHLDDGLDMEQTCGNPPATEANPLLLRQAPTMNSLATNDEY